MMERIVGAERRTFIAVMVRPSYDVKSWRVAQRPTFNATNMAKEERNRACDSSLVDGRRQTSPRNAWI
jgi:hypothetical protein